MPNRLTRHRTPGWKKPAGAIIVDRSTIWGNPWAVGTPGLLHTRIDGARVSYRLMINVNADDAVFLFRDWLHRPRCGENYLPDRHHLTTAGGMALRDHLHARRQLILSRIHELRGHDMCCPCKQGQPCHADVLLEMANGGEG